MKHPEPFKQGEKVAGFTVMQELGRGAASIIYLVQDPKTKQIWALKHVSKADPKDQRFLDQTESEHEIGSKLDHPRIRKLVKLVKNRKLMAVKEMYLVMEYVDGASVETHPPPASDIAQTVDIFRSVAEGLAYMHERGFIHADMKPSNIVITENAGVKIIDLGQSCAAGTVKPRIQGTPDYIAPEQVHRQPIMPQTDVYNLGATMYWVLTRRHIPTALPKGDSLVSSLDAEFIEKPRPIGELNPAVPERLAKLIMQCVEPTIEVRPPSMQIVHDELDLIYAQTLAKSRVAAGEIIDDEDDA